MRRLYTNDDCGYFFAIAAVACASMSFVFCSTLPPPIPLPTMFNIDSTRVLERSIIRCLKSSKFRHTGTACVNNRGHSCPKHVRIGIDAAVTSEGIGNPGSRVYVNVDVDETRCYIESFRIDDFLAVSGWNVPSRPSRSSSLRSLHP